MIWTATNICNGYVISKPSDTANFTVCASLWQNENQIQCEFGCTWTFSRFKSIGYLRIFFRQVQCDCSHDFLTPLPVAHETNADEQRCHEHHANIQHARWSTEEFWLLHGIFQRQHQCNAFECENGRSEKQWQIFQCANGVTFSDVW